MKKFTLGVITFMMTAAITTSGSNGFTGNLLFTAKLDGVQETPSVTTSAIGVASFALNRTHDTMCVNVSVRGLSGPITLAHIHEGAPGVSGSPVVTLTPFVSGNRLTTMLTGANLTPTMVSKFMKGLYYINFHTSAHPNGEIRGQILLETDYALSASLNGAQVVPAVATSAYGLAVFNLYQDSLAVIIDAKFVGLSGPITVASLHSGMPGATGPVVDNLTAGVTGNSLHIEVAPAAYLTDLLSGNIYLTIQTTANPNGEIRGQVLMDNKLAFDVLLDSSQETPPTSATGTGVGIIKINSTLDTMSYDIVSEGLTSTPTLAHLHPGAPGVAGPPLISLTGGINGSRVSGIITGASLTLAVINQMLEGDIYANIHTSANPNGEIRGQVGRYAREGLTYEINGAQENPPNSSTATGCGFASIDRFKENIHFMLVVTGLTSTPLTGAHFHQSPSGGVLFSLASLLVQSGNDVNLSGYWTDDDVPAFDATFADMFLSQNAYVNLHTSAFSNGEVRGQMRLGGSCFSTPTGILENNSTVENFSLYPNPANNNLNLAFTTKLNDRASIIVSDIQGRELLAGKMNVITGENKTSVDLSSLDNGLYMIRVDLSGKAIAFGKFVKQ